jgi:exosome complex component RRP41
LTELLPRSSLHVVVTVLSADGSVRAAVMNAATLALADAGVPLRDTCAASCATVVEGGTPCVDPTHTEESKGPELYVALLPSTGKVPLLLHEGARCGSDAFPQVVDAALGGARAAASFMKAELIRHAQSRAASILASAQ